jgi:hypothetical protein
MILGLGYTIRDGSGPPPEGRNLILDPCQLYPMTRQRDGERPSFQGDSWGVTAAEQQNQESLLKRLSSVGNSAECTRRGGE